MNRRIVLVSRRDRTENSRPFGGDTMTLETALAMFIAMFAIMGLANLITFLLAVLRGRR